VEESLDVRQRRVRARERLDERADDVLSILPECRLEQRCLLPNLP